MNKDQLGQQLAEKRLFFIGEGIVDEFFFQVESLKDTQPNFVKNIVTAYFPSSAAYMNDLERLLSSKPLDLINVERLILKLKGGSATMGMARFNAIIGEMFDIFKARRYDRLHAAFMRIKEGHEALKMHLEPYVELLRLLRECPLYEASDNHVDVESVDCNDDIRD